MVGYSLSSREDARISGHPAILNQLLAVLVQPQVGLTLCRSSRCARGQTRESGLHILCDHTPGRRVMGEHLQRSAYDSFVGVAIAGAADDAAYLAALEHHRPWRANGFGRSRRG